MAQQRKLLNFSEEQWVQWAKGHRYPAYRGRQIFHWLHKRSAAAWRDMSNLPSALVQLLEKTEINPGLICRRRQISADGTEKFLLALDDEAVIETVYIPELDRATVCVSSQVGCAMDCSFCATGKLGLKRNLTAGEIVGQVAAVIRETGATITHVVFMGMGEPLANLPAVLAAIALIAAGSGQNISMRRMTVSTCGLVPQMMNLAAAGLGITLAVSLHAPDNLRRSQIMPINRRYPLEALLPACRAYAEQTGRRISFEYALVSGFNDFPADGAKLAELVRNIHCHVNVIPVNPVDGRYMPPPLTRVGAFARILESAGIRTTIRQERGQDIAAACGQLAGKEKNFGEG